jgi:hypothetical protein
MLKLLNVVKVNAVEDQLGRVKTPQSFLDQFVDLLVVWNRRFPAHPPNKANHFHESASVASSEAQRGSSAAAVSNRRQERNQPPGDAFIIEAGETKSPHFIKMLNRGLRDFS